MASDLLTDEQEKHIIRQIQLAERETSGEIRVHIENRCPGDALVRAAEIFHDLGMDQTKQQNGVLIYIASDDHKAAVYAGKGIHTQVEDHFWNDVLQLLLNHFKKGEYEEGIADAVRETGKKLAEMYPSKRDDVNELSNDISYHDNSGEENEDR